MQPLDVLLSRGCVIRVDHKDVVNDGHRIVRLLQPASADNRPEARLAALAQRTSWKSPPATDAGVCSPSQRRSAVERSDARPASVVGQRPRTQQPERTGPDAIGQGRLTFSPLGMAQVAAAIDSGVVRAPRLVDGARDDTRPPWRLPVGLLTDLRAMMTHVTTAGTAAGTGLPVGTGTKTGTAEYGAGPESHLKIDGWLMGYHGDIAFAIVTRNTGGPVDGPPIAKFLNQLGPGA